MVIQLLDDMDLLSEDSKGPFSPLVYVMKAMCFVQEQRQGHKNKVPIITIEIR